MDDLTISIDLNELSALLVLLQGRLELSRLYRRLLCLMTSSQESGSSSLSGFSSPLPTPPNLSAPVSPLSQEHGAAGISDANEMLLEPLTNSATGHSSSGLAEPTMALQGSCAHAVGHDHLPNGMFRSIFQSITIDRLPAALDKLRGRASAGESRKSRRRTKLLGRLKHDGCLKKAKKAKNTNKAKKAREARLQRPCPRSGVRWIAASWARLPNPAQASTGGVDGFFGLLAVANLESQTHNPLTWVAAIQSLLQGQEDAYQDDSFRSVLQRCSNSVDAEISTSFLLMVHYIQFFTKCQRYDQLSYHRILSGLRLIVKV